MSMLGVRALAYDNLQARHSQAEREKERLQAEVHRLREWAHHHEAFQALKEQNAKLEAELSELKKRDQDRETYLRDREKEVSQLRESSSSYSQQADELRKALEASVMQMAKAHDAHFVEIEKLKGQHEQDLARIKASSHDLGQKEGLEQGIIKGVRGCRSQLLLTAYGQAFPDHLVRNLPEAFLHSPDFWVIMTEPLTEWAAMSVFECCHLLGIPKKVTYVNLDPIVRAFGQVPETLEPNRKISLKNPWYLQVLQEASDILHRPRDQ